MFRYPWELEKPAPNEFFPKESEEVTPPQDFKMLIRSVDGEYEDSWDDWMLFHNIYTIRAHSGREAVGILSNRIGRGIREVEFCGY